MITMVTGGQRSGKSAFAESLVLGRAERPIYVATARVIDDDFRRRVDVHRQRRGDRWTTVEVPLHVSSIDLAPASTVLVDCLTLLATNWFFECGEDADRALPHILSELEALFSSDADFVVVTNEVGLGGVSANALQRRFADLQGAVNQAVASRADEVYFVVSGIPVKIKDNNKTQY